MAPKGGCSACVEITGGYCWSTPCRRLKHLPDVLLCFWYCNNNFCSIKQKCAACTERSNRGEECECGSDGGGLRGQVVHRGQCRKARGPSRGPWTFLQPGDNPI